MHNEGGLKAKLWRHKLFLTFCHPYLARKKFQDFFPCQDFKWWIVRKQMPRKDRSNLFSYFEAPSLQIVWYLIWLGTHRKGYSRFSNCPTHPTQHNGYWAGKSEKITRDGCSLNMQNTSWQKRQIHESLDNTTNKVLISP